MLSAANQTGTIKERIMSKKLANMVTAYLAAIQDIALGTRHIIEVRYWHKKHSLSTREGECHVRRLGAKSS